jgi:hypothetical protein
VKRTRQGINQMRDLEGPRFEMPISGCGVAGGVLADGNEFI